jgi:hypothetical protein
MISEFHVSRHRERARKRTCLMLAHRVILTRHFETARLTNPLNLAISPVFSAFQPC